MGWEALESGYVDIYARNFTDEQLDALLVFYKSPAGLALVEKQPTLTSQGSELAQSKMAAIQPQLKQMIQEFARSAVQNATPAQSPQ